MIMDKRKVLPYVRSVDTAAATKALDALAAQIDESLPLATPLELSEEDAVMPAMRGGDGADGQAGSENVVYKDDGKSVDDGILAAALKAASYTLAMKDVAALRACMVVAGVTSDGLDGAPSASSDILGLLSVVAPEPSEQSAAEGDPAAAKAGVEITIGSGCRRVHEVINTKAAHALEVFGAELLSTSRVSILRAQTGAAAHRVLSDDVGTDAAAARLARCVGVFKSAMAGGSDGAGGSQKRKSGHGGGSQPRSKQQRSGGSSVSSSTRGRSSAGGRTLGTPIIVIPASVSSLLSVHNVEEFLRSGRFVSTRDSKARKVSAAPKDGLRFAITLPGYGAEREFRFVDNPLMQLRRSGDRLGEWAKIVAVVANGNEWQFKGWPKGFRTPADIFTKSQVRRVRGVVLFSSGRS
jgi:hypothetical protein